MCFKREKGADRIYCAFNISDSDVTVRVEEAEGTDLLSGGVRNLNEIFQKELNTLCFVRLSAALSAPPKFF